jgi:hypothetical protein
MPMIIKIPVSADLKNIAIVLGTFIVTLTTVLGASCLMAVSISEHLLPILFARYATPDPLSLERPFLAFRIAFFLNLSILFSEAVFTLMHYFEKTTPKASSLWLVFWGEAILFASFVALHLPDGLNRVIWGVTGLIVLMYYTNHFFFWLILLSESKRRVKRW